MPPILLGQTASDAATGALLSIPMLIIGLFVLALAICWLILPFILMSRMSTLQKSMDQLVALAKDKRHFDLLNVELQAANIHLTKIASAAQRPPAIPGSTQRATRSTSTLVYFVRNGDTQGPIEEAQLRSLYESGTIDADTPAMREGSTTWRTASEILY